MSQTAPTDKSRLSRITVVIVPAIWALLGVRPDMARGATVISRIRVYSTTTAAKPATSSNRMRPMKPLVRRVRSAQVGLRPSARSRAASEVMARQRYW